MTPANKALLDDLRAKYIDEATAGLVEAMLRRAEAQANESYRTALRNAVVALPTWDKRSVPGGKHVKLADVLAILDA